MVKYTNFPHKKISVFEAHQCADIKIHGDELITGGYDRTICIWKWETGSLVRCLQGSVKPGEPSLSGLFTSVALDVFNGEIF